MTRSTVFRSFLFLLAAAVLLTGSWASLAPARAEASSAEQDEAQTSARVIAVKFHADWCGYCKAMGDVFQEMQAKFDQQPVLWVTLDHTRENDRKQSEYLAHAMGMQEIWSEHGGKTGFILLVNGKTGEVMDRLGHELSLKEMGAKLAEAVDKASS